MIAVMAARSNAGGFATVLIAAGVVGGVVVGVMLSRLSLVGANWYEQGRYGRDEAAIYGAAAATAASLAFIVLIVLFNITRTYLNKGVFAPQIITSIGFMYGLFQVSLNAFGGFLAGGIAHVLGGVTAGILPEEAQ
jgi:hypothetical protein